jgi:O-antigen biosynthesis protein WbqV
LARGGEVFTLEMGEPVNILGLAHKLIRLSGQVPGRDIAVHTVGARPGEKRHEELVDDDESPVHSGYPGIVVSHPAPLDPASLRLRLRGLEALAREGHHEELAEQMRSQGIPNRAPIRVGEAS